MARPQAVEQLLPSRALFLPAVQPPSHFDGDDDEMQSALEAMYRSTGAGKDPVCPARMAMAALMQGYLGVSDAEAVQLTMVDLRWQMVRC